MTINAANVTGNTDGINALNDGSGVLHIITTGDVKSISQDGIDVENQGTDLIIEANNVIGDYRGINALNEGSGDLTVIAGNVEGGTNNGIVALNRGNDLTITADQVNGENIGIEARNFGNGGISITVTDSVTGTDDDGIFARNAADTTDVKIEVGTVTGNEDGIEANNLGTGVTSVIATGAVTGATETGIDVRGAGTDLIVQAVDATGGVNGIFAANTGSTGTTKITTTGDVTGTNGDGIYAIANGTDFTMDTNKVTGDRYGIFAMNNGDGAVSLTTNGEISASTYDGIYLSNSGTNLTLITNDTVSGGDDGIYVNHLGTGTAQITTHGLVQGDSWGINLASTTDIDLSIMSTSTVQNSTGGYSDDAITISGDVGDLATINNDGRINGAIYGGDEDNTFSNNGQGEWYINVNSDFGGGANLIDNIGSVYATDPSGTPLITIVENVSRFQNSGGIYLQNNQVGDILQFEDGGNGVFDNQGGQFNVDVSFDNGVSDMLRVDNVTNTLGATTININILDGLSPTSGDGIEVVDVLGFSQEGDFALSGGPYTEGLYSYGLGRGYEDTQSFFIQSHTRDETVVTSVLPILGSRVALSTLSNLHERQRDVKVLSNDQDSSKGVWGRIIGQGNKFESEAIGFDTTLWGAQAGIDLLAKSDGTGNRKYAGLYVSYASSNGDALHHGAKVASIDLDATTLGAYYTKYSSEGWYLDAVVQYSWLNGIKAKTATDEIKPGGSSYALSLEAGRQFKPESSVIREVQAQLIYQNTDIDNVTLADDTSMNLSGLSAVTGRFGVRLYGNPDDGKKFLPWVRANLWHTFSKDSSISSMGSTLSTPIGGTSGELQAGFTLGPGENGSWNMFASAGYLFDISGASYSGWKGTLGFRKGW